MATIGEQLDVVTPTGEYVETADRRAVHDQGRWHQVFHCLVIRSGTPARIVLQRRHQDKAAFPGLLDLSATGHLHAGESPSEGVRELNEELGIGADGEALVPVGVRLLADDDGEGANRERVHLFFLTDDRPLDEFRPEPTEVESLVEVGALDLLDLIARLGIDGPVAPDPQPGIDGVEWHPGAAPRAVRVTADDLIKPSDGYWTVLLLMAERFAAGERPLAI